MCSETMRGLLRHCSAETDRKALKMVNQIVDENCTVALTIARTMRTSSGPNSDVRKIRANRRKETINPATTVKARTMVLT
jgi:hypothetical protein